MNTHRPPHPHQPRTRDAARTRDKEGAYRSQLTAHSSVRKLRTLALWLLIAFVVGYVSPPVGWFPTLEATAGPFTKTNIDTAFTSVTDVAVADIDGDGDKDLFATSSDTGQKLAWYENTGSGFTKRSICGTDFTRANAVAAGDIDGDGDQDAILAAYLLSLFSQPKLILCRNDGGTPPSFSETTIASGGNGAQDAYDVGVGDLDGDSDLDIAVGIGPGTPQISWYRNNGNPLTFTAFLTYSPYSFSDQLHIADLNADGRRDIVIMAYDDTFSNEVVFLKNTGNGGSEQFEKTAIVTGNGRLIAAFGTDVHAGDVDLDGDLDIVFNKNRDEGGQHLQLAVNDGTTMFTEQTLLSITSGTFKSVHLSDIDGDCDLDVAFTQDTTDSVGYVLNNTTSWSAATILGSPFTTGTKLYGVTFNAGVETDLLGASKDDADIALWTNATDPNFGACAYVNACARAGQGEAQGTTGVSGIPVSLTGTSNGGGSVSQSATTNSLGDIQFVTSPSNSVGYTVSVGSVPSQYEVVGGRTKGGLVVALRQTVSAACFTLTARGAHIHAYEDSNASRAYETGIDGNLPGASVEIFQGDSLIETGITNNKGIYHLRNVQTGVTYEVHVSRHGFESNGDRPPPFTFSPSGGQVIETVRTGFIRIAGGGGGDRSREEEREISVTSDADRDGLLYLQEDRNLNGKVDELETDPRNPDSDSDGLLDGEEVTLGTDPLRADSDGDSVLDGREVRFLKTDPRDPLKGAVRRLGRKGREGTEGIEGMEGGEGAVRINAEPVVRIAGMMEDDPTSLASGELRGAGRDRATLELAAHLVIKDAEFAGRNPLEVVFFDQGLGNRGQGLGTEPESQPEPEREAMEAKSVRVAFAHEGWGISLSTLFGGGGEASPPVDRGSTSQPEAKPQEARGGRGLASPNEEVEPLEAPRTSRSATVQGEEVKPQEGEPQPQPLPQVTLPLLIRKGEVLALLMLLSGEEILTEEEIQGTFSEGLPFEDIEMPLDVKERAALSLFAKGVFEGIKVGEASHPPVGRGSTSQPEAKPQEARGGRGLASPNEEVEPPEAPRTSRSATVQGEEVKPREGVKEQRYADLSKPASRELFLSMVPAVFGLEIEGGPHSAPEGASRGEGVRALSEAPEKVKGVMKLLGGDLLPRSLVRVFAGRAGLTSLEALRSMLLVSLATGTLEIPPAVEGGEVNSERKVLASFVGVELREKEERPFDRAQGEPLEGVQGLAGVLQNWEEEEFEELFVRTLRTLGVIDIQDSKIPSVQDSRDEGFPGSFDSFDSLDSSLETEGLQRLIRREQERLERRMERERMDSTSPDGLRGAGGIGGMEGMGGMMFSPGMEEGSFGSFGSFESFGSSPGAEGMYPGMGGTYELPPEMQGDYGP